MDEPLSPPDPDTAPQTQHFIEQQQGFLHSRESWRLQELDRHLLSVSDTALGPLTDVEKLSHASLFRYLGQANSLVDGANAKLTEAFERDGLQALRAKLRESTGQDLDPKNTYIHTLHMEFKESGWQPGQRSKRDYAAEAPLAHVYSLTLWQAACLNYGFDDLFASDRTRSSWINSEPGPGYRLGIEPYKVRQHSIMSVESFVAIARALDLGSDLKTRVDAGLDAQAELTRSLEQQARAEILFSPYEAYRNGAQTGVTHVPFSFLKEALWNAPDSVTVNEVSIKLPDTAISAVLKAISVSRRTGPALRSRLDLLSHFLKPPLFTFKVRQLDGLFSYFPGRLGGALRYHSDQATFQAEFKQQLKEDNAQGRLSWFLTPLSIAEQTIVRDIVTVQPRPEGLNAVTGGLYDGFHWVFPGPVLEKLQWRYQTLSMPPEQALKARYVARARSNLDELAVKRSVKDWQAFVEGVSSIIDEVLGMLLLPVPGGLRGMGRVVAAALFGSLGYNFIQGVAQATQGRPAQLAQSVTDIGNLMISARLHRHALKWSIRRHQELARFLGTPYRVTLKGQSVLWTPRLDRYLSVKIGILHGAIAHSSGVIEHDGRQYAELLVEGEPRAFELEFDSQAGQYRLMHADPQVYRPVVSFDPDLKRWQLVLDRPEVPGMAQLAERLLPGEPLTVRELEQLARISGSTSQTLQSVWEGEVAPAALVDSVKRHNTGRALQALDGPLVSRLPLPLDSDRALFAVLTQLPDWPGDLALAIHDQDGVLMEAYGKLTTLAEHGRRVSIRRLADGGYVDNQQPEVVANHELGLVGLILALLPVDSALRKPDTPAQAPRTKAVAVRSAVVARAARERRQLFEALSRWSGRTKSGRSSLEQGIRQFLPVATAAQPAVFVKALTLHPELSHARVAEWLRRYPLSSLEQRAFLESGRLPEVADYMLSQMARGQRLEQALDGIYHARAWDVQAYGWAQEGMGVLLRENLGMTLEILEGGATPAPTVAVDEQGKQLFLRYHGPGKYARYDPSSGQEHPVSEGEDSFYRVVEQALERTALQQLGIQEPGADNVGQLRRQVGDALAYRRTSDGDIRPWNDSAFAYRQSDLPDNIEPDARGVYRWLGKDWVRLGDAVYQVDHHPVFGDWGIEHPRLPGACRLELEHNGAGAWWHEQERPLEWQGVKLFRRLGPRAAAQSEDWAQRLMAFSDVGEELLRKVHVTGSRGPGLLMDSLHRVDSHLRVADGIDRLENTNRLEPLLKRALGQLGEEERLQLLGHAVVDEWRDWQVLKAKAREDALGLKTLLGNALDRDRPVGDNPFSVRLRRHFPGLPEWVADEMIERASFDETRQLRESDKLPLGLAQEARWLIQDARLVRALEGLEIDSLASADSERLALHLLEHLPGWPGDLRVEVRQDSASGPLFGSVGDTDATGRVIIIRSARGYTLFGDSVRWSPIAGLFYALPESVRGALVSSGGRTPEFRRALSRAALSDRGRAKQWLGMRAEIPGFVPPQRLADGRIGYRLSGGEGRRANQLRRYRNLYTGLSHEEAQQALESQGLDLAVREHWIGQRKQELQDLRDRLKNWRRNPLPGESRDRLYRFAKRIKQCWRREARHAGPLPGGATGYRLDLDGLEVGRFPLLPESVDFSHVTSLSMCGMALSQQLYLYGFLRQFRSLRVLDLSYNRLESLLDLQRQLPELTGLDLSHNLLAFIGNDFQRQLRMSELLYLDLSDNPLGVPPVLDELHLLENLNLHKTRIERVPEGLEQLRYLRFVDLTDNRIQELADRFFTVFRQEGRGTEVRLANNPLSPSAQRRLQYFKQLHPAARIGLDVAQREVPALDVASFWWLSDGAEHDVELSRHWQALEQAGGEGFLKFFREMARMSRPYLEAGEAVRRDTAGRLGLILARTAGNDLLRQTQFDVVSNWFYLKDRSVFEVFRHLELNAHYDAASQHADLHEAQRRMFVLVRGQFRLEVLLGEVVRQQTSHDERRVGAYLSQLADLELAPLFFDPWESVAVRPDELELIRRNILHAETAVGLEQVLLENKTWEKFLLDRYREEHDQHFEQYFDLDLREGETEQEYLDRSETSRQQYLQARTPWLRTLTQQALTHLDPAPDPVDGAGEG